jgi:hypothetical protein
MEIDMTAKAKKNEIVAIETQHTYHEISMEKTRYATWQLAQATRCNRQGIVERVRYEPNGPEYILDHNQRVFVIGGSNQDLAALLWPIDREKYSNVEDLKNAVLNVAATA